MYGNLRQFNQMLVNNFNPQHTPSNQHHRSSGEWWSVVVVSGRFDRGRQNEMKSQTAGFHISWGRVNLRSSLWELIETYRLSDSSWDSLFLHAFIIHTSSWMPYLFSWDLLTSTSMYLWFWRELIFNLDL